MINLALKTLFPVYFKLLKWPFVPGSSVELPDALYAIMNTSLIWEAPPVYLILPDPLMDKSPIGPKWLTSSNTLGEVLKAQKKSSSSRA